MEVFFSLENIPVSPYAVVTAGTFDGVHKGHQKIVHSLVKEAKKHQGHSFLITYHPHPRQVLQPEYVGLKLLSTLDEKLDLLAETDLDYVLVLPFTKEFSKWDGKRYVEEILVEGLNTKKIIIGYDHRFGKNRSDGIEFLQKVASNYGFEVEEIAREDVDSLAVSSTRIRQALASCDVSLAEDFIGHPYALKGTVVAGKQLGRTIGYPTANIAVSDTEKLIPGDGIYAVQVLLGERRFGGMMSIGMNPTVEGTARTIEVYIFDFNEDIYGQEITVSFIAFLRKEEKFEGLEALKAALAADEIAAKDWLSKHQKRNE